MVGLFHVLSNDGEGNFAAAEALRGTDGALLMVHHAFENRGEQLTENICTRPFACDWDGDGDLDLLVGNFKGTFFVFDGEGEGRFAPAARPLLDMEGAALKTQGVHSDPFVIDWDGDGDLDLLATSHTGTIELAENQAISGEASREAGARLAPFRTLISPTPQAGPAGSTRMHVADVDGDGDLDLLVGDKVTVDGKRTGQVWLYRQN